MMEPPGFHILKHLCFLLQDALLGFQKFQVCHTDVGNDTDVRAGCSRQFAHLAKVVDAHFQDRYLVGFVHLKNGKRKSAFIVEISLSFMYIVFL